MRLINAETFPNELKEMMIQIDKNRGAPEEDWFLYGFDEFVIALDVIDLVKEMPTVEAEPVRHGRWIKRTKIYPDLLNDSTYNYECSNCGYMDTHGADVEVPYCWHCGAKMDDERRNEHNKENTSQAD